MESFYTLVFLVLLVGIVGLESVVKAGSREGGAGATKPEAFKKFRNNYLVVYSLMMGACAAGAGPPPPCGPPPAAFPPPPALPRAARFPGRAPAAAVTIPSLGPYRMLLTPRSTAAQAKSSAEN